VDAGGENNISGICKLYRKLGKRLFAVCDKQSDANKAAIDAQVEQIFMHEEATFEDLILKDAGVAALERFSDMVDWPPPILAKYPNPTAQIPNSLRAYFDWSKGNWGIADFLAQCTEVEIPEWILGTCASLKELCDSPALQAEDRDSAEEVPTEETSGGVETH